MEIRRLKTLALIINILGRNIFIKFLFEKKNNRYNDLVVKKICCKLSQINSGSEISAATYVALNANK